MRRLLALLFSFLAVAASAQQQAVTVITPDSTVTADVTINAAIARLPSTGGTIDARSYGCAGNPTIASTINVGTSNQQVTLIFDTCTQFIYTISNGTPVFSINNNSSIIAFGSMSQAGQINFFGSNTSNVTSIMENSNKTNGFGMHLANLTMAVQTGGVVTKGGIWFEGVHGVNQVSQIETESIPGCGILIDDNVSAGTSTIDFFSMWAAGGAVAGAQAVCINSTHGQGVTSINFFGGSLDGSGTGLPGVSIKTTAAGLVNHIHFYGIYSESSFASSPHLQIDGAADISVDGWDMVATGPAVTNCIVLTNASGGSVRGIHFTNITGSNGGAGCTNLIRDNTNGGQTISNNTINTFDYGVGGQQIAWYANQSAGQVGNIGPTGNAQFNVLQAQTIYSAAGTPAPTCPGSIVGARIIASDITTATYRTAYVSGGTNTGQLLCTPGGWVSN